MGIATSVDYGRKLAFQYRFDKLGMDQRLKELQELANSHEVEELHIIAPILRRIANDPNLMNISRKTAEHLIKQMEQPRPSQWSARHTLTRRNFGHKDFTTLPPNSGNLPANWC